MTTPIRIVRIIARMNVGGPAVEVSNLMRMLPADEFEQTLVIGYVGEGEADYLETQARDIAAVRVSGLGRALKPMDDLRALFQLRRILKSARPDIVHTHTAKAGALGRLAALTIRPRPKLVHTYHGHVLSGYFSSAANFAFALIERVLAAVTDELITVGPEVREQLLAAGIGRLERFHVVEPGVSLRHQPSRTDARASFGIDDERPVISVVGRLTQIKRPDRMLEVVAIVRRRFPSVLVLVAGDGELRSELEARVQREELPVRFIGWTDDVETVFAASDLTLLTSDNEGTPISLMQAAMLGVPAVATDVGSVRHVVVDGHTGWLSEPDAPSLARCVVGALADLSLAGQLGSAARTHVEQRYSVARFIAQHAELYRTLT